MCFSYSWSAAPVVADFREGYRQLVHDLGVLGGEVFCFTGIVHKVVELMFLAALRGFAFD
jgi:hypothetical protein